MVLRDLLQICKFTTGETVSVNLFDKELEEICNIEGNYRALNRYILGADVISVSPSGHELRYVLEIVLDVEQPTYN